MHTQKIYQVDAFTDKLFGGNPAAVCIMDKWLPAQLMQQIAAENNLAETAFVVANVDNFGLRWFTPTVEVALCGHATLAAAFVIFNFEDFTGNCIEFSTEQSGMLRVTKNENLLTLNFPADVLQKVDWTSTLLSAMHHTPEFVYKGKTDYMLVYRNEHAINNLTPDFAAMQKIPVRGIIATAPGNQVDFVSRFFAPQSGINEDPVTGSAHTSLIPYWANRLGKNKLEAMQLSSRGGKLFCAFLEDRVAISGFCKLYLLGQIYLESHE